MNSLSEFINDFRYYEIFHYTVRLQVTNQMITTCKHYVMEGKERIWELARDVVLERIANCVRLNEEYQKAFHRYGFFIALRFISINSLRSFTMIKI